MRRTLSVLLLAVPPLAGCFRESPSSPPQPEARADSTCMYRGTLVGPKVDVKRGIIVVGVSTLLDPQGNPRPMSPADSARAAVERSLVECLERASGPEPR